MSRARFIDDAFTQSLDMLSDYLRIPNVSPAFDAQWEEHGHIDRAAALLAGWAASREITGLTVETLRLPGLTPVILCEVPAFDPSGEPSAVSNDTVLFYGHLDKQPELGGWRDGLSPWEPVLEGDRLYGRGGADDGYAIVAALTAIEALQRGGTPHDRCVVLIEGSEESGSPDLPAYLDAFDARLGDVGLVIALDSGARTWDRLWVTTSLRGLIDVDVRVDVLEIGVHSGAAGGIVPSSFRVLRHLLDRIEDSATGKVRLEALHVTMPADRVEEASITAEVLGDTRSRIVANTWQPSIAYIGVEGMPPFAAAGNVLRPFTAVRLAVRLPPHCDAAAAGRAIEAELLRDPPAEASVSVTAHHPADGWNAPPTAPWLAAALAAASLEHFGAPPAHTGEGGTIPFMAMLGERFPGAQFVVTGVLGPESNAHGPDEFLDLACARKVTACVTDVVAAYATVDGGRV